MANGIKHGFISKTVGLSLGFLGIVGLVVSLVSLVPVNVYNMFVSVNALTELLKYELQKTHQDWWALTADSALYSVFLTGSIASSLITIVLVLATCFRQGARHGNGDFNGSMSESPSVPKDLEEAERTQRKSVWLSRMGCLIFVGQIGWVLFGTHLLFFMDEPTDLPDTIRKSTMISVMILWLNYLIITIFSFILFCASLFIILGVKRPQHYHYHHHHHHIRRPSSSSTSSSSVSSLARQNNHRRASSSSVGNEELQCHYGEATPLLQTTSVPK